MTAGASALLLLHTAAVGREFAGDSIQVELVPVEGGQVLVRVGEQAFSPDAIIPESLGIELGIDPAQPGALMLGSAKTPVVLTAADFESFRAELSEGQKLSMNINAAKARLKTRVLGDSHVPVWFKFSDGGEIAALAGDEVGIEEFDDGSYLVGGGPAVKGKTSDGAAVVLDEFAPPMGGGPLLEVEDGGRRVMKRVRPMVTLRFIGDPGMNLQVELDGRRSPLIPDEETWVRLPNGAACQLLQNSEKKHVAWVVRKGDFRFQLGGVPGWSAVGLSGQSAEMQWNPEARAADLRNTSEPGNDILILLQNRNSARVSSGAFFQYSQINSLAFAAAANHGRVLLRSEMTGQTVHVEQSNLLVRGGVPVRSLEAASGVLVLNMRIVGDSVAVFGGEDDGLLSEGRGEVLHFGELGEVHVEYQTDGRIRIQAVGNQAEVRLLNFDGMKLQVTPGDSVWVYRSPVGGELNIEAPGSNASNVMISAGTFSPILQPQQKMSLEFSASGVSRVIADGGLLFTEQSGGEISELLREELAPTTTPLDVSRVPQPPLSAFR